MYYVLLLYMDGGPIINPVRLFLHPYCWVLDISISISMWAEMSIPRNGGTPKFIDVWLILGHYNETQIWLRHHSVHFLDVVQCTKVT